MIFVIDCLFLAWNVNISNLSLDGAVNLRRVYEFVEKGVYAGELEYHSVFWLKAAVFKLIGRNIIVEGLINAAYILAAVILILLMLKKIEPRSVIFAIIFIFTTPYFYPHFLEGYGEGAALLCLLVGCYILFFKCHESTTSSLKNFLAGLFFGLSIHTKFVTLLLIIPLLGVTIIDIFTHKRWKWKYVWGGILTVMIGVHLINLSFHGWKKFLRIMDFAFHTVYTRGGPIASLSLTKLLENFKGHFITMSGFLGLNWKLFLIFLFSVSFLSIFFHN